MPLQHGEALGVAGVHRLQTLPEARDVLEDPGVAQGAAGDHYSVHSRLLAHANGVLAVADAAVAEHGDPHRRLDRCEQREVDAALVPL